MGRGCGSAGESGVAKGVIIPQGVAYCCLSLCDKTKRTGVRLHRGVLGAFIPALDNVLTSCSRHHRDHIKDQICGGTRSDPSVKEKGV